MRCFDEPINLRGSSVTEEFVQLVIQFEYCDKNKSNVKFKSRAQAEAQMKGKAILILSNQRTIEVTSRTDRSL